ncbi:SH3 domain-containing protein [Oribacterium sp. Sow4_G1_1]|uniref:SH3 domain-containing protein n=1 Tax=Oribacterium sp. Sow4_G1_1 TaxID=3438794 RepID=UPI003F9884CB
MKKHKTKSLQHSVGTALLSLCLLLTPAGTALNALPSAYAAQAAVIRGTNVNVRSSASTSSQLLTSLGNNTTVSILNQTTGSDGKVWYQISAGGVTGYVRSDLVSTQSVAYTTDANFEAYLAQQGFPESYKAGLRTLHAQHPTWIFNAVQTGLDWNTAVASELQGTSSLVETGSKSSWKSTDAGKFDWTSSTWPGFDGATWVGASREIVAYFMDPRNFLDDSYVFQFAVHDYNAELQTIDGLRSMLQGTFLSGQVAIDASSPLYAAAVAAQGLSASTNAVGGQTVTDAGSGTTTQTGSGESLLGYEGPGAKSAANASSDTQAPAGTTAITATNVLEGTDSMSTSVMPGTSGPGMGNAAMGTTNATNMMGGTVTVSYADILMEAAEQSKVSPYMLAAMILQEQGSKGTSGSISGATGYYNYFNVGAYAANGMTAVERGLWYAAQSGSYNRPWNTPEKAIVGGALFYAQNYLSAGQNTLYLKRFNVQGSNMFKHQYMTNTAGAAEEGKNLGKAYTDTMRAGILVFNIPVYNGMPETPCPMPTKDGNPNNKLQYLAVDGFTLTPSFNLDTTSYTLVVDPSVQMVNVSAVAYHSAAQISGAGQILLDTPTKVVTITVTAQNGDQRNYQITISQSAGGQLGNTLQMGMTGSSDVSLQTGTSMPGMTTTVTGAQTPAVGVSPTGTVVTDVVAGTNGPM